MPRDGSPGGSGGPVPPAPMNVGEVADPPFAVLPDPGRLFAARAARFEALAPGHHLQPYLELLGRLSRAQHRVVSLLPPAKLPAEGRLATALANAMPPISIGQVELDTVADAAFTGIVGLLDPAGNEATAAAIATCKATTAEQRRAIMQAVLLDEIPADAIAAHVLAAAALQVHFARLAAQLDAKSLQRVADGACPACGGAPVASMVVGWEGAHGTRFCACSICATQWHAVRIKCLVCSSEKGIAYQSLDGGSDTIMGETCESCSSYVKMLHQHKDKMLDPVADDVASLALDLTLQREGWQRASVNAFLMGY